jgi:hypothetical protein
VKRRLVALIEVGLLALAAGLNAALAQSNVQIFYVGCADKGVIELSGEMASATTCIIKFSPATDGSGSAHLAAARDGERRVCGQRLGCVPGGRDHPGCSVSARRCPCAKVIDPQPLQDDGGRSTGRLRHRRPASDEY